MEVSKVPRRWMSSLAREVRRRLLALLGAALGLYVISVALRALAHRRRAQEDARLIKKTEWFVRKAKQSRETEKHEHASWAADLITPRYDADMLVQWRVVTWAVRYGARCLARRLATALALQGMDDLLREEGQLDEHAALRSKRCARAHEGGIIAPESLRALVGNTPLLAISFRFMGRRRIIYAKSEQYNFSGSVKDRMALHILEKAYASGALKAGDLIVEASSGNSGISFAALGRALGHPVAIYMPDWMSAERKTLLASFGAQLVLVSALQGGFIGAIRMAQRAARLHPRVFLPEQFSNAHNAEAHQASTGPEILLQLASIGVKPAAFVAGVGTGGTIMGVARAIRSVAGLQHVRMHPVEPAESPTLTTGKHHGHHRIQGISDEFVPPLLSLSQLDEVIPVPDGDAIRMSQKLARELGLGVGISSGANFLAALEAQERLGGEAAVVTIFCDDNKKYLSSALVQSEPLKERLKAGYRSQHVELESFQVIPPLPHEAMSHIHDGTWTTFWEETLEARSRSQPPQRQRQRKKKIQP